MLQRLSSVCFSQNNECHYVQCPFILSSNTFSCCEQQELRHKHAHANKKVVFVSFFFLLILCEKRVHLSSCLKEPREITSFRGEQNSCRLALKTLKSFTDATLPFEQLIGVKLGYKLLICFQGRKSDNEFEMICH